LVELLVELIVEQAGEIAVKTFVSADQLVGKGDSGEDASLLEPEYSTERAREENAFDDCERDETLGERGVVSVHPPETPLGLLFDDGHRFDRVEQLVLAFFVANQVVDKE
jgi:hypothetical protein